MGAASAFVTRTHKLRWQANESKQSGDLLPKEFIDSESKSNDLCYSGCCV